MFLCLPLRSVALAMLLLLLLNLAVTMPFTGAASHPARQPQTPVRFYMYPPSSFRGYNEVDFSVIHQRKHNHGVYAIRAASRHPWRINSVNDARIKVAFIPILLDHIARTIPTKWNAPPKESNGILEQMAEIVLASPLYPRVRHVLIANDWISANYFNTISTLFPEGNVVIARMENMMSEYRNVLTENGNIVHQSGQRQPYACSFGLGYTSSYTAYQPADFKRELFKKTTAKDEIIAKGSSLNGIVQPFVPEPAKPGIARTISIAFSGAVGYAMHGRDQNMPTGYKHRLRLFEFGRCNANTSPHSPTRPCMQHGLQKRDRREDNDAEYMSCGTCGEELPNVFMAAMETDAMVGRYTKKWWNVDAIPLCPNQQTRNNGSSSRAAFIQGYSRCSGPVPLATAQHARELANFSLALRGDTLGSDRWINAMVAGAVPVHVGAVDELGWLPFQTVVPWSEFIVTIPEEHFMKDPFQAMKSHLLDMPDTELAMRRKLMRSHIKDVDWGAHHSRTFENFLAETLLVPATKC